MTRPWLRTLAVLPIAALALTGCGDEPASDPTSGKAAGGSLSVVASTNVYGDIAQEIGGDLITVTSIITSSTQDPHEYEPSAQDRLTVDEADVVIENGAGYDTFVDTMLEATDADPAVLVAVEESGLLPDEEPNEEGVIEGFNEHVWYSFPSVEKLAQSLNEELAELDPDNAATYESNLETFTEKVDGLEQTASGLQSAAGGRGVAITEPVPLYLLDAVGLTNQTPEEFSEAVEEGTDVPARVLQETLALFDGGDIALLAYNSQASDSTTEQVRSAAEAADVPVVDFTETLPDGQGYLEWQQANLDAVSAALG